LKKTNRFLE